jgi:hypothetical protein
MIWYICLLQLGWHPVAVVQYTFTHKQYTEYRERNIHNNKKFGANSGSAGRAPSLRVIPWHLPYNWGKCTEKTSVREVEKWPDIPVAVVQYTFTQKQYTEQHNETECTERNNKNTQFTQLNRSIRNIQQKRTKHSFLPSNLGSAGRASSLRVIPWHLPYNWGKSTEKPQLG